MSDFLKEIQNFSKGKLRKVETVVKTPDGKQFVETKSRGGIIIAKLTSKGGLGYVSEVEPDLQVAEILPGLSLGSEDVYRDVELMQRHKITHILSLATGSENCYGRKFQYKYIDILDLPEVDIRSTFDQCFEFINQARSSCGHVFVHCSAGVSRSPTIIIAYLMKTESKRYTEALEFVKSKRPTVKPNDGFTQQLIDFDKDLFQRHPASENEKVESQEEIAVKKQEIKVEDEEEEEEYEDDEDEETEEDEEEEEVVEKKYQPGFTLTKDERVSLVFMYGRPGSSNKSIADDYNQKNPGRPSIDQETVGRLIKLFRETGSVLQHPRKVEHLL